MALSLSLSLEANRLTGVLEALQKAAEAATAYTAGAVAERARLQAQRRSGAMAEGAYVATPQASEYSDRLDRATALWQEGYAAEAKTTRSHGRQGVAPTVSEVPSPEAGEALVSDVMAYAVFQELGTTHLPARPWLGPAAQSTASELDSSEGLAAVAREPIEEAAR